MYDSRADTYEHISKVQQYMLVAVKSLLNRALVHDASKLTDPEKAAWDEASPKLGKVTYGSDEYREELRRIKPIVQHHYRENSHHPEHYPDGVRGMSLLDVLEMLCDWKAASQRTKNGDIMSSIDYNQKRFGFSDDLANILRNTAVELGLLR
jgi:hypothetical protein